MEDAVTVAIAKGVESHIAAALDIGRSYVLQRSYAEWDLDLKGGGFEIDDSEQLHIDVVSNSTETANQLSARGKLQFDCPIDVAVRMRLQQTEQQSESGRLQPREIDDLMKVVEQLHVLLTRQRLPDFHWASWQSTQVVAAPIREHLRSMRQFTGIIRVVFRADIAIPIQE